MTFEVRQEVGTSQVRVRVWRERRGEGVRAWHLKSWRVPRAGEHHKCISLSIRNGGSLPAFLDAFPVLPDVAYPESWVPCVHEVNVKISTRPSVIG